MKKTITVDFFNPLSYYEIGRDVTDELYKIMHDCNEKYKDTTQNGEWGLSIPDDVLMQAAGEAQKRAGTSRAEFKSTFDDDPRDQLRILQGIEIFNQLSREKE